MNADIFITSQSYGETSSYNLKGDLRPQNGGFALTYTIDGDSCTLIYSDKTISQSRKGSFTYSVNFIPHKKCSFEFEESGLAFSREIYVFRAEADLNFSGCEVKIVYADCGTTAKTELFIRALYKIQQKF